ncbi:MAG: hypothetical protein JWO71_4749 [Candidatus Acidoferrum typicum]|nr:hypothetical protein [Candidatus Acidoferrum typicum]
MASFTLRDTEGQKLCCTSKPCCSVDTSTLSRRLRELSLGGDANGSRIPDPPTNLPMSVGVNSSLHSGQLTIQRGIGTPCQWDCRGHTKVRSSLSTGFASSGMNKEEGEARMTA